jgi:crotonobetainyl-CoA:carnitine CoA-transferase CaiB-like acyl-CoA transferase
MGALDGITVLDLGEVMQAPFATQALADFGAEVIKVERPGRGDVMRGLDRGATERGEASAYYVAVNRGKRSVCLDLKQPAGRDALLRMIPRVDVLVHNFRPGAMERLRLGHEDLAEINPGLIYAVALGFGETGPWARKAGQDLVSQSISGIAMHRPSKDQPPYLHPVPFVDYAGGMTLAQGILLALLERERSGLGQKVSISLFDTALAMQMLEVASHQLYGEETNWVADTFPNATFATADGWITVLGFFRDNPLKLMCAAMGMDDLSAREEYSTPALTSTHKEELNRIFAAEFAGLSSASCIERLEGVDVLCAPVLSMQEVLKHPQVAENGLLCEVEIDGQAPASVIGNPLKLSRTGAETRRPLARLGAHTAEVLAEMDFAPEEIAQLEEQGAFGSAPLSQLTVAPLTSGEK